MKRTRLQVGWFVLPEDTVFTNHFETAAWYEDVKVPAGRYPLLTENEAGILTREKGFYVNMDGVIVSDNFQSLFAGSPVGQPYDSSKNAGKEASHYVQYRNYELAYAILEPREGREFSIELLPQYKAVYEDFISALDGKPTRTAKITFEEKELERVCMGLLNHPDPAVRLRVANEGFGLETLVSDPDYRVRAAVARQGYGLERLEKDPSAWVREAVYDGYAAKASLDSTIQECESIAAKQQKRDVKKIDKDVVL